MRSKSLEWPPKRRLAFPEEVKKILRKPLGQLISGDPDEVARKVKEIIEEENPLMVVAVGDYTSEKLRSMGAWVNLYVVDGRVERRPFKIFDVKGLKVVRCVNEPGTLNPDSVSKLHKLLTGKRSRGSVLVVEGEEDLLTLAAIISAPEGSMIVYGQPGAGNVIVRVRREVKEKAVEIIRLVQGRR